MNGRNEGAERIKEHAKSYLYLNGRLLDRKRYEYHFEGGSKEAVLSALRAYQNADGGFGNALEPDLRCPHSQPVPTEMALEIMDEVNGYPPDMLEGIGRYLKKITLPEGGVPYVFPDAADYPHAPWWGGGRSDVPSLNPTGRLIGMLYKNGAASSFQDMEWFCRNEAFIWQELEKGTLEGYHDAVQWISFLQHTPDQDRAAAYKETLNEWLSSPGVIERDPSAQGYVQKVLDWAPERESYASALVSGEEIARHLAALAEQQMEDGAWPLPWETTSPGVALEWRGWVAVNRLLTLRSYGVFG